MSRRTRRSGHQHSRWRVAAGVLLTSVLVACSTTGTFRLPPDTELEVLGRKVSPDPQGIVVTKPFFWSAAGIPPAGGIPYRLSRGGQIVKQGKLRAKIRPVAFFWPPAAIIYWPIGFNEEITYDLVSDRQE